jgi:hypothetical protein
VPAQRCALGEIYSRFPFVIVEQTQFDAFGRF